MSVLTVVYNHERFVAESIESVLAQNWPADRLEHVIVDDGSTDGTAGVIARYRDHVRYIHQENQGVLAAVNRGMEELSGDVITGAGGDDAWPQGRLERLIGRLRENPRAGLVYSDLEVIDADSRRLHPSFMAANGLTGHRGRIIGKLLAGNFVSGGGCMMRGCLKPVFHPVPPHAAWEDWWWAWAIGSVAEVEYLDEPTYRYRRHDDNLAFGATGAKLVSALGHELRFRRWTLANVEPEQATPSELVEGIWRLYGVAGTLARESGMSLDAVLPADPTAIAGGRLEAAQVAFAARQPEAALFHCAAALAADPLSLSVRTLLARVAPGAEAGVPVVQPAAPPAIETRAFVVVADADALVERPDVLAAYGRSFSDADDATLVILATAWSPARLKAEFPPLVARSGLDGTGGPDMLAVPVSAAQRNALRRAAAASLEPDCDPAVIRGLAEERWTRRHGQAA